ncbi:MAG: asparaginase [Oscillospiraceae bacterium]|nr:asparaginase [Oscillospiraceae bacterium]
MKKKILLLSTGGTIAAVPTEQGLQPAQTGEDLITVLGSLPYDITIRDILSLDSTNIQPEEWQYIARCVYEMRSGYDGIVITHGTDTMAYTASMLTFMLQGIELPVILTGSQLPMTNPLSDAPYNLRCALEMAASGIPGIFIAFDRKILLGCRSVKVRTTGFDAFESVKAPVVAKVNSDGLQFREPLPKRTASMCCLRNNLDSRVVLIKLIPGFDLALFRALPSIGIRGVVIEAFGSGGLNFFRRDLISVLGELVDAGISVVVCSQCLYERSDLTKYEVGRRALEKGVIPGEDMTTECAVTKLMWAIGQGMTPAEIAAFFQKNVAGEVTV